MVKTVRVSASASVPPCGVMAAMHARGKSQTKRLPSLRERCAVAPPPLAHPLAPAA